MILSGCGAPSVGDVGAVRTLFAMDTMMQLTVYGEHQEEAVDAAQAEISRLEGLLSRTRSDSQITALNRHAGDGSPVAVDPDVYSVLSLAQEYAREVDGAFDITVAPIMDAWGFVSKNYRVPSQEELARLLPLVDGEQLRLEEGGSTVQLAKPGMAVDLGAIAKGYTAGRVEALLRSYGVEDALIVLGGNVTAMGRNYSGDPWRVAVRDPLDGEAYLGILPLQDVTASTSGGYERYFEQDGRRYYHIIDPTTGLTADSGLLSVTVISSDAARNDALSTALFVMGTERAEAFWRAHGDFEMVLVQADKTVLITQGLEEGWDFRGERNGYQYEILHR